MMPPGVTPPGVHPSLDGAELATTLTCMEWFMNFYDEAMANPNPYMRPRECVVHAGDVIFVPCGWWHLAVNLEETVALTQNFVSRCNLPKVLDFLEEQPHNISGLAVDQRPYLFDRFTAAMQTAHPELLSEAQGTRTATRTATRKEDELSSSEEAPSSLASSSSSSLLSKALQANKRQGDGDAAGEEGGGAGFSFSFSF